MLDLIHRSSYIPPGDDDGDYEEEKGEGYIEVLPDHPEGVSIYASRQSLVSTQSSGQGNYVNVAGEDVQSDTSSQCYINVDGDKDHLRLSPGVSLDNVDSDNNSNSDYVNVSEFINNTTSFQ
ncbi:hypothetical protein AAFF_G00366960 [Aldrovandia affinis]|uniref:Uncharacterized protein n=1 Tax=Aldrovandia affinis TaxID=143900 RepID=A0AAD7WMX0_9TELE|nr:hypothetical protein AAFF_G00366960 [Aldrovandia affinis]